MYGFGTGRYPQSRDETTEVIRVGAQDLDQEVRARIADDGEYDRLVERLSKASVDKHYEPYIDIAWDDPRFAIDPADPRWALPPTDPLSTHPWYLSLPAETRSRIGLWRIAASMKTGVQFENLLKRGLLWYAFRLPNASTEFRYAYHEVIEEGHHGMMFQEFVNRTGMPVGGVPRGRRALAQGVPLLGRIFPELFFFFVLGGEDPIDFVQRQMIAGGDDVHPLLERIIRIHVAEEARHLSFARHYLRRRVPGLGPARRQIIAIATPIILGIMAKTMLAPTDEMIRHFEIPDRVIDEAYRNNARSRAQNRNSLTKVRELADELGLINRASRAVWKRFKIWPKPGDEQYLRAPANVP
jgi:hypothetical protein